MFIIVEIRNRWVYNNSVLNTLYAHQVHMTEWTLVKNYFDVNWTWTKVNVSNNFSKRNALSLFIVLVTWILWTVSRADDWISFSPKFVYLIRALKEHKWVPDIDFTETCLSSFYPLCSYKYIRFFAVLHDGIKNIIWNNKNIFSLIFFPNIIKLANLWALYK